jgi:hypothetical protein
MTTETDTVLDVITTPEHTPKRRYRYHRRTDSGYWRTEYEWTGCLWRMVDRQKLSEISIHQEVTNDS